MLGFNLRKRLVNTFVKLQFHHIYGVSRFKRNVDATFGGVLLNINSEIGEQGKYNIKHLLVMPLRVRIIAIRNRLQKSERNVKASSISPRFISTDILAMVVLPFTVSRAK